MRSELCASYRPSLAAYVLVPMDILNWSRHLHHSSASLELPSFCTLLVVNVLGRGIVGEPCGFGFVRRGVNC